MSLINLPPFYVGQKVVRLKHDMFKNVQKGKVYTVASIKYCCEKWGWRIALKGGKRLKNTHCECGSTITNKYPYAAENFAPLEEKFEMISFKKVIKQEQPSLCEN